MFSHLSVKHSYDSHSAWNKEAPVIAVVNFCTTARIRAAKVTGSAVAEAAFH